MRTVPIHVYNKKQRKGRHIQFYLRLMYFFEQLFIFLIANILKQIVLIQIQRKQNKNFNYEFRFYFYLFGLSKRHYKEKKTLDFSLLCKLIIPLSGQYIRQVDHQQLPLPSHRHLTKNQTMRTVPIQTKLDRINSQKKKTVHNTQPNSIKETITKTAPLKQRV